MVDKGGLRDFIRLAWPQVEPRKFIHNWHIDCVSDHLSAVTSGDIRNLLINMPPGSGKSLMVSVFWPVWDWIKNPGDRWIYASYDVGLTQRDGRRCIELMQSPWFQQRWPDTQLKEKNPGVTDFWTTAEGWRYGTSVLGKVTGRHADYRVIDDPNKPMDSSKHALQRAVDWHDGTFSTRIADPKTSRFVCMMQRLAEADLSGVLEARGNSVVLRLPMEYEAKPLPDGTGGPCVTPLGKVDPRTEQGELLDKKRHDAESLEKLKSELKTDNNIAAQLQQRPVPEGGSVFKEEWLRQEYDVLPQRIDMWLQSWDCTFADEDESDFVCGGVWAVSWPNLYLVDLINERLSFTDTCAAIKEMTAKWPRTITKLVEKKANGPAVVNLLKQSYPGFIEIEPEGGKISRANAATPVFRSLNVHLNRKGTWLTKYRKQLKTFPVSENDDMVDMTSQAVAHILANKSSMLLAMEELAKQGGAGTMQNVLTGLGGRR